MSQDSIVLANASGAAFRAALNLALARLATTSSGNTRPGDILAQQFWIDTNTPSSSVWSLFVWDGTHDIKLGELNSSTGNFTPFGNGASLLAGGTTNTSSSSLATMANVQASMTGGFVNKFRNPQMAVAQRGTSGTITAGTPAYSVDGWIISATGANVAWSQLSSFAPSSHYLEINGATSNTKVTLKQRIESQIAAALAGQTVTIYFALGNFTGSSLSPALTVKHAGAVDDWSSPTTDVNAVALQSISDSTNGFVAYTFSCPSGATNGLEITLDFGAIGNTKFVNIGACDIRATPGVTGGTNNSPPVPELRNIAAELAFCQRYLPGFSAAGGANQIVGQGFGSSSTAGSFIWLFNVPTRIPVTGITVSAASNFSIQGNGFGLTALTGMTFGVGGTTSLQAGVTAASGLVANPSWIQSNSTSANLIATGAEL